MCKYTTDQCIGSPKPSPDGQELLQKRLPKRFDIGSSQSDLKFQNLITPTPDPRMNQRKNNRKITNRNKSSEHVGASASSGIMVEQQEAEILRCRAHFDASQSVKENKNNLSADIKDILAEEAIDPSTFRIHYAKVIKKNKKEPHSFEYVLVGLQISDVKVADKLRKGRFAPDGPAIAGKRTGAITALWAGKKPAKAQPDQKANGVAPAMKKKKVQRTTQKESSTTTTYLMVTAGAAVAAGLCVYLLHHHRHRFAAQGI